MKNKIIINIIKALSFCILFCVIFKITSDILRDKTEATSISNFYYEPKDTLDVVFFGSSHMFTDVYPMELWNDYGIASYNFGQGLQSLPLSYYSVQEVINKQHPKLIVIEMYMSLVDTKIVNAPSAHKTLDNIPLSLTKIKAIKDCIEPEARLEYLLTLSAYHSRWKSLTGKDFDINKYDYQKGALVYKGVYQQETPEIIDSSLTQDITEIPLEYINKIIDLCDKKNTDLLFVTTPYYASPEEQKKLNMVYSIAEKADVKYLNLFYYLDELKFDYSTDMFDTAHQNVSGAKKTTSFLGKYIKDNYDIPDRRNDSNYSKWDEDYKEYKRLSYFPKETMPFILGDTISFTAGGNAPSYFTDGISVCEGTFTWSSAKESNAYLYIDEKIDTDLTFDCNIFNIFIQSNQKQIMELYVNDNYVDKVELNPGDKKASFIIPKELIKNQYVRITLKYPNAERSKDAPEGERELAIGFESITISAN